MTYIYSKIRTEIYETRENNPLKQYRSIKDIKRIFKKHVFVFFIMTIICFISFVVLAFKFPGIPIYIVPFAVSQVINIIYEYQGEKIYNLSVRQEEIEQVNTKYKSYIVGIIKILKNNNIYSVEKLNLLINECNERLLSHSRKFDTPRNKAFDNFIWVPISVLLTLSINNSDFSNVNQILFFILLGYILVTLFNTAKKLNYLSDGYFKDKYLYSVLKEIQYADFNI